MKLKIFHIILNIITNKILFIIYTILMIMQLLWYEIASKTSSASSARITYTYLIDNSNNNKQIIIVNKFILYNIS